MKYIVFSFYLFLTIPAFCQENFKEKVIFDCDLGDDIDDMFALSLLLSSPEIEVIGLVMDYGNTPERAKMALKLLEQVGMKEIPVVIGRQTNSDFSPQYRWSSDYNGIEPHKNNAVTFISSMLNRYPNEINLITVGPVTNLQDLIASDKKILQKAKHIYAMFGAFKTGYTGTEKIDVEWNVKADLKASKSFISSLKGTNTTFIPLDVTHDVVIDQDNLQLLNMRRTPLTDAICANYVLWRFMPYAIEMNYLPIMYDPVAIGALIWPDLFVIEEGHVFLDHKGQTLLNKDKKANAEVALHINKEEFIRRMMERLLLQNINDQ